MAAATDRTFDMFVCTQKWHITDPKEAFPSDMQWPPNQTPDDEVVHQLRRLAEICDDLAFVKHAFKWARSQRKSANKKNPRDHALRVDHIISPDVRAVYDMMANAAASVPATNAAEAPAEKATEKTERMMRGIWDEYCQIKGIEVPPQLDEDQKEIVDAVLSARMAQRWDIERLGTAVLKAIRRKTLRNAYTPSDSMKGAIDTVKERMTKMTDEVVDQVKKMSTSLKLVPVEAYDAAERTLLGKKSG